MTYYVRDVAVVPAEDNRPLFLSLSVRRQDLMAADGPDGKIVARMPLAHWLSSVKKDRRFYAAPSLEWSSYLAPDGRPAEGSVLMGGRLAWWGYCGTLSTAWGRLLSGGSQACLAYLEDLHREVFGDAPGLLAAGPGERYSGAVGL